MGAGERLQLRPLARVPDALDKRFVPLLRLSVTGTNLTCATGVIFVNPADSAFGATNITVDAAGTPLANGPGPSNLNEWP